VHLYHKHKKLIFNIFDKLYFYEIPKMVIISIRINIKNAENQKTQKNKNIINQLSSKNHKFAISYL
jgi:hypothetical protein